MILNILINFTLINTNDDESLVRDFTSPICMIEEMCFRSIKCSLEIAVVPIRKFLILFSIYLKLLFGESTGIFKLII